MAIYGPLFEALAASSARYVVVGGVAVVLHGHARLTADIDLIVDLEPDAAGRALAALERLGLRPRLPVAASGFADASIRRRWITEKGMQVFSLWSPSNPLLNVDIFVEHPIDFETLWGRSEIFDLGGIPVRVASIPDLIALKRIAGRGKDIEDIARLEEIARRRRNERD